MKRLLFLCTIMLSGLAFGQLAPVPYINNPLVPARVAPGSAGFTLTINGNGFTSTSAVYWNGSLRPSTLISSHQLTAQVYSSDVAKSGFGWVTVSNQGIGSAFSNVAYLEIGGTAEGVGFQSIPFDTTYPGVVAVGDFNNDGILDFVVDCGTSDNKNGMAVYLGTGNGSFKPPLVSTRGPIRSMVVGDFNGDGNLDIATAGTDFHVFLGNGDGTFTKVSQFVPYVQNVTLTADFNNDGKLDLMVQQQRGGCYILFGNGDGTFQYGEGGAYCPANSLAVGDFNGDGYLDLASVGINGPLYISLNQGGSGEFKTSSIPITYPGETVAAADVNGDGILDIVSDGVSVMLGDGEGSFTEAFSYEMPSAPDSINLADFNGDGKLDIAAGPYLMLGNGNGTFGNPVSFANMFPGEPTLVGPFNPDGAFDLIGVDGQLGPLMLYKNEPAYLQPTELTFGQQPDGEPSAPLTATLTNYSRGPAPLTNLKFGFTGAYAADFSQTNNCGTSLPLNQTCQIQVVFTPSIVGNESASLNVSYGTSKPIVMPLTGTGTNQPYTVTLVPTSLTFPLTVDGQTAPSQSLRLTNTGNPAVTISGISNPPPPFSQTNNCPTTLPSNEYCTITVSFAPTDKGVFNSTISVTDNAQGSPQQSSLSGTGTAVAFNPTSLNFGDQPVGQASIPLKFMLKNLGTGALTISQIQITGADPNDFSQQNNCGSSLAGGSSCTITVTFNPTAKGARSAGVQFTDNDPTSPQTEPLSGKGT
ncbi:MAG TPA: choice-of-anchor D domain-containing protein [Terriglobales bacterium]